MTSVDISSLLVKEVGFIRPLNSFILADSTIFVLSVLTDLFSHTSPVPFLEIFVSISVTVYGCFPIY
jgi:hypothetical protein